MGCNTSQEVKAKKTEEDGAAQEDGKTTETEQTMPAMNGDASAPSVEDSCSDAANKSSIVPETAAVTKEPTERDQNAQNNGIQKQHGKQQQQQKSPEVPAGDVTIVDDGKHHNGLVNGDINDDTSSSNVKRCDKAEISELNNVDIDGDEDKDDVNDDDDEEKAATKIQAAFRGHKVRATMKKSDDTSAAAAAASTNKNTPAADGNSKAEATAAAAEAEPTKEELEAEFDPNDKDLCNAALKIQATFRGHLSRKLVGNKEAEDIDIQEITKKVAEELDIDLSDPELNKAATKIQASFRGHKSRKDIPA
ncbi:uncharacterized protein LOC129920051 [Episyrphus balteatus]|uniref:uncharacterized protein LOC129920051 n=1 Tax=Episyrphus balteatus TaxID=286459 RepID=UPI002485A757|nr:uncharacterized protein LOC129920051 [Episyrphus balteatus]